MEQVFLKPVFDAEYLHENINNFALITGAHISKDYSHSFDEYCLHVLMSVSPEKSLKIDLRLYDADQIWKGLVTEYYQIVFEAPAREIILPYSELIRSLIWVDLKDTVNRLLRRRLEFSSVRAI